jgi:abortive infection bacteriophage resistance protein
MIYSKPVTTIELQIKQLAQRGLEISDISEATIILSNISYYRLAGYWWPMQDDKTKHTFKKNSRLNDVIALYNFDSELRILLFDIIEKIEISLRAKLIYHLSHDHGFWWFQNTELFINIIELSATLANIGEEITRSKDIFIKEHKKKYVDDYRFPPSIKTLEITSFGALSKLYGNLKPTIKAKDIIAFEYGTVNHTFLPSWLQSIAQIRNICAHHGRLWNKNLPGTPNLLPKPPNPWLGTPPNNSEFKMLYVHLCCMKYLLNVINPKNSFTGRLEELLRKYSNVDLNAMGMPNTWLNEPLWKA